ncbi:24585_t:CDS:1, partial [Cetraspora pellucida]
SLVDESYSSFRQDAYDSFLNTVFPVTFIIFFKVTENSGRFKKAFLPILDDILYNIVTWVIPLIVSFTYNLQEIMIFSIANAIPHLTCALIALILQKTILEVKNSDSEVKNSYWIIFLSINIFLIIIPALLIPLFWIVFIIKNLDYRYEPINLAFLTLFATTLGLALLVFFPVWIRKARSDGVDEEKFNYIFGLLALFNFYSPNFLQTLFIVLTWPINFYLVKLWVFTQILSLTRSISYYDVKKIPDDFLATSTATTQWRIHEFKARKDRPINNEIILKNILKNIVKDFSKEYMNDDKNEVAVKDMLRNVIKDILNDNNVDIRNDVNSVEISDDVNNLEIGNDV